MSDNASSIRHSKDVGKIARERLLWATKPLGAVLLTLWVLSPEVTAKAELQHEMLLGFLMGAVYGIFFHHELLRDMLFVQRENVRKVKNRLPDEFYWGKKTDVLFKKED